MTEQELFQRYTELCHAMQTGVKYYHNQISAEDGSRKHLRVGVNTALVQDTALVELLVEKGLITRTEYFQKLIEVMTREVKRYESDLTNKLGMDIKLV